MTDVFEAPQTVPEKGRYKAHIGSVWKFRPFLGVIIPQFPYAVEFWKAVKVAWWNLYRKTFFRWWVAVVAVLVAASTAFVTIPVATTAWSFSWAAFGVVGPRVTMVASVVGSLCWVAWVFVIRKDGPSVWPWLAGGASMIAGIGWTVWQLNVVGMGALVSAGFVCAAADALGYRLSDRMYLRSVAGEMRGRWAMTWQIIAGKTKKTQGAVGGGESSGGPLENVGGGRLELDHPALDAFPHYDVDGMAVTWRIFVGNGRDVEALKDTQKQVAAAFPQVKKCEIVAEDENASYGAFVVKFHPRPDLMAIAVAFGDRLEGLFSRVR